MDRTCLDKLGFKTKMPFFASFKLLIGIGKMFIKHLLIFLKNCFKNTYQLIGGTCSPVACRRNNKSTRALMSHTFNVQITLSLVQLNHGGVEGLFLLNLWQSRLIFHSEVISISIFLALVHLQQGGGVELQIKPRNRTKNYWTIRFIDLQYACLT